MREQGGTERAHHVVLRALNLKVVHHRNLARGVLAVDAGHRDGGGAGRAADLGADLELDDLGVPALLDVDARPADALDEEGVRGRGLHLEGCADAAALVPVLLDLQGHGLRGREREGPEDRPLHELPGRQVYAHHLVTRRHVGDALRRRRRVFVVSSFSAVAARD